MTKIFLPTELGVKGEGSNTTIKDVERPDVKEVLRDEDPAVSEQPEIYKARFEVKPGDLTMAEQRAGKENTVNQSNELSDDPTPSKKDLSVEPGELAKGDSKNTVTPKSDSKSTDNK